MNIFFTLIAFPLLILLLVKWIHLFVVAYNVLYYYEIIWFNLIARGIIFQLHYLYVVNMMLVKFA